MIRMANSPVIKPFLFPDYLVTNLICSVCLFSGVLTCSCSLLRRRGLQRVCSPIRPKGATLNQAISDQSSVNCRCCIKILLPYLPLSHLTSISLSSFFKLCASTLELLYTSHPDHHLHSFRFLRYKVSTTPSLNCATCTPSQYHGFC